MECTTIKINYFKKEKINYLKHLKNLIKNQKKLIIYYLILKI